MLKGFKLGLAVFVSTAMMVGCAGSNSGSLAPRPAIPHSAYGKLRALADGSFHNVNDAPRHRDAANFEARRAAAHARGLWLTDELNAPNIIRSVSKKRSTMSTPVCSGDTCGGGGDPTGPTESYFDDNGGNYPFDVEADFPDGTSILYESFTDSSGNDFLTTLETTGIYDLWFLNGQTRPPTNGQPTPGTCLIDMEGFVYSGGAGPCPTQIPKIWCPLVAGVMGLGARWAAIAFSKNPEAGNAAAVVVGGSYLAACNSQ